MKRSSILLLSLLLSSAATFAQTKVTMGVTRGKDFGVTYLLPKTEVEIEIKSVKTSHFDCLYAFLFELRLTL